MHASTHWTRETVEFCLEARVSSSWSVDIALILILLITARTCVLEAMGELTTPTTLRPHSYW